MQDRGNPGYPAPAYAWFTVAVLFLAYVCSYIDRMIISLMVEPIKADLALSDTQISLLQGLAFAVLYTAAGLPIGWLVDRRSRVGLMAVGVAVWSVMTAACGFAQNYLQLFLARVGVGIGEAALSPAAYSVIADSFPQRRLGLAMGAYNLGAATGGGLAMMIGGYVVAVVMEMGTIHVPLLGDIRPWQAAFLAVGAPGLVMAALVAFLREPERRDSTGAGAAPEASLEAVGLFMRSNIRTLGYHHLGVAFANLGLVGVTSWVAVFFIRVHGWAIQEVGLALGLALIFGGLLGLVGGGWLGDRVSRQHPDTGKLRVCALTVLAAAPFAVSFALVDNPVLSVVCFALAFSGMVSPIGNAVAALQQMTPNRMRGVVSAFYLFAINVIGLGLGATLVALLSDYVFAGPLAVRYSLLTVIPSCCLLSAAMFRLSWGPYRTTLATAAAAA